MERAVGRRARELRPPPDAQAPATPCSAGPSLPPSTLRIVMPSSVMPLPPPSRPGRDPEEYARASVGRRRWEVEQVELQLEGDYLYERVRWLLHLPCFSCFSIWEGWPSLQLEGECLYERVRWLPFCSPVFQEAVRCCAVLACWPAPNPSQHPPPTPPAGRGPGSGGARPAGHHPAAAGGDGAGGAAHDGRALARSCAWPSLGL